MNLYKKYREEYKNMEGIDGRNFYFIVPVIFLACLISTTFSLVERMPLYTTIASIFGAICCICIFFIYRKSKNYVYGLLVTCVFTSLVLVPMLFFTYGGYDSAMPLILIVSMVMITLCIRRKYRTIITTIIISINTIIIILSMKYPNLVTSVNEDLKNIDYVCSFVIFSGFLQIVTNYLMNQTIRYSKVVSTHLDKKVTDSLMYKEKGNDISGLKNVAGVFIDVCHFTANSEKMQTEDIRDCLNKFFEVCEFYINQKDGIIDKFIGDCVMAFWIDDGNTNASLNACIASKQICASLDAIRKDTKEKFGYELLCSSGVAYGEVLVGDIGSKNRRNFTVIGDTVNVASRLEGLAGENTIYVTEEVVERLGGALLTEKTNIEGVRGKMEEISIYQVLV